MSSIGSMIHHLDSKLGSPDWVSGIRRKIFLTCVNSTCRKKKVYVCNHFTKDISTFNSIDNRVSMKKTTILDDFR